MTVSASVQTLEQGPRNLIMQWIGIGDGNGNENLVIKVNASALTPRAARMRVNCIKGVVAFGVVELFWDSLTPVKFAELSGESIDLNYRAAGGLVCPPGIGNGNILLSTKAFELNSTYDLYVEMVKK